jgi:hypothetical protein
MNSSDESNLKKGVRKRNAGTNARPATLAAIDLRQPVIHLISCLNTLL